MKQIFYVFLSAIMAISSAFAINIDSNDDELSDNLIGDWICESIIASDTLEIIHQSSESYLADGSGFSQDSVLMKFSEKADQPFAGKILQLDILSSAKWQIKDKRIIYKDINVTVNNISDPELAEQLGLNNLTNPNEAEYADLVEMTKQTMTLLTENDLGEINVVCQRKMDII